MRERRIFTGGGRELHPNHPSSRVKMTPLRRCRKCGTMNDTRTTAWSDSGEGLVKVAEPGAKDSSGQYSSPAIFEAKSGCNLCGCLGWTKGRPRKLKDESMTASRRSLKRRWR